MTVKRAVNVCLVTFALLVNPLQSLAATTIATQAFIDAAVSRTNAYRAMVGLDGLSPDIMLNAAAQAHASYQQLNGTVTHSEDATKPGYLAASPSARISAEGYKASGTGEIISYVSPGPADPDQAINSLMNTVGHRVLILMPTFVDLGVGAASSTASGSTGGGWTVVDFAYPANTTASTLVVMYPSPGMTGVPCDFQPATEAPNPFPTLTDSSSPVTIQFSGSSLKSLTMTSFTISDSQGNALPSTTFTDPNNRTASYDFAVAADQPFAQGETYTATFIGTVNGQPFSKTTRFTAAQTDSGYGLTAPTGPAGLAPDWTSITASGSTSSTSSGSTGSSTTSSGGSTSTGSTSTGSTSTGSTSTGSTSTGSTNPASTSPATTTSTSSGSSSSTSTASGPASATAAPSPVTAESAAASSAPSSVSGSGGGGSGGGCTIDPSARFSLDWIILAGAACSLIRVRRLRKK